jgi:hypothetical protein
MKFRTPELFLGAFLAVAIFAMGMLFASSKYSETPQQNNPNQTSETKSYESHQSKAIWIPEDATGFFTLWIAAFTAVLAISTIGLWASTRRGILSQADDTRILQRAYIRAVPKGVDTMTAGGFVGHVSFENEGRLPATNFKWIIKELTIESDTWKPPKLNDNDLLEYSSIVPVAGIFRRWTPISPGNPVEDKYWFVWGRVRYLDGFGKERFVDFCHSYPIARREIISGGHYIIRDEFARYHDYGNDAD